MFYTWVHNFFEIDRLQAKWFILKSLPLYGKFCKRPNGAHNCALLQITQLQHLKLIAFIQVNITVILTNVYQNTANAFGMLTRSWVTEITVNLDIENGVDEFLIFLLNSRRANVKNSGPHHSQTQGYSRSQITQDTKYSVADLLWHDHPWWSVSIWECCECVIVSKLSSPCH